MMKLFYSATSPYVRKVMIIAHHLGVTDKIEKLDAAASPVTRDRNIVSFNPLTKVPAAMTDDGLMLFDSRVICEYLDSQGNGGLFPSAGRARWIALMQQALGDGLLDAALLVRYERAVRPPEFHWQAWDAGQFSKIIDCLNEIEKQAPTLEVKRFTIGEITIACALGYLDFRFPEIEWRSKYPLTKKWFEDFAKMPAMVVTEPPKS